MECVCRYRVVRDFGPWKRGWFLIWNMTDPHVSVVACLDRYRVAGWWGPDAVPVLLSGVFIEGALVGEYFSPRVEQHSMDTLRSAHDFSADVLDVA